MNRTENKLLALWSDITAYARFKAEIYKIPLEEVEDLVAQAYLIAQSKLKRHKAKKSYKALLKTIAWSTVMDELKKRNYLENLRIRKSVSLDAPKDGIAADNDGDEIENDGFLISDDGAGVESVYSSCDSAADCDREPDWVYLTRAEEQKLYGDERIVCRMIKKTSSLLKARRSFCGSDDEFRGNLKKLQVRFDPCFTAYCAYRAEKSCRRV